MSGTVLLSSYLRHGDVQLTLPSFREKETFVNVSATLLETLI